jgi:NAD(P)-dependent dehydrogenase (short-subunit alcohol dehydrogenase family)
MMSRSRDRGEAAKAELGSDRVHVVQCDLSSFEQVRRAAAEVLEGWPVLHLLVNNAGAYFGDRGLTDDGHERTWQVNHLGHFLLTGLLLDRLKATPPARIVHVSSRSHLWGRILWDDPSMETGYDGLKAYGQSKLANVLFSHELARRLDGTWVTSNALHPGVIRTQIARKNGWWGSKMFATLRSPFMVTPETGARTNLHVAMSPDVEGVTGKYFSDCKVKTSGKNTADPADQARLWALSEAQIG